MNVLKWQFPPGTAPPEPNCCHKRLDFDKMVIRLIMIEHKQHWCNDAHQYNNDCYDHHDNIDGNHHQHNHANNQRIPVPPPGQSNTDCFDNGGDLHHNPANHHHHHHQYRSQRSTRPSPTAWLKQCLRRISGFPVPFFI